MAFFSSTFNQKYKVKECFVQQRFTHLHIKSYLKQKNKVLF